MNTNAARSHATLAGILFFIYGFSQFLLHIWNYTHVYFTTFAEIPPSIATPLFLGIAFGVIAVIRANNLAGVIVSGIGLLVYFIDLVRYPCFSNFVGVLSGVALLVLVLFVSIDPLKKLAPWVEQLWFVAPILFMITYIIFWISSQFFTYFTTSWTYFILIPIVLIRFFATFFFALWLKDEAAMISTAPKMSQHTVPPTGYAPVQGTMRQQSYPTQPNPTWKEATATEEPTVSIPQASIPHPEPTHPESPKKEAAVAEPPSASPETPVQENSPDAQSSPAAVKLDPIESLKVYRELLANGLITQQAFEEKKQQLMKLI